MKVKLLSVTALCCVSAVKAQPFRFCPTIGGSVNISNKSKAKVGFAVGAKAEANFKRVALKRILGINRLGFSYMF